MAMALLVSTKIVFQYAAKTAVARDWRVVMIPEDGCTTVTFANLYQSIVDHTLDPLEPFVLPEDQQISAIRVQIGKEQAGHFQDIPVTVRVVDAMATFGVYVKYFLECEEPSQGAAVTLRRNGFEVSFKEVVSCET